MATASQCDMNLLDSKEICSICLEPYAGRNPKLLPCFHTFCVECLSDLAQVSSTSSEEGAGCATITCPACRKVSPVPAGGVASFQNNFYIDQGRATKKAAVASPCQLCDGGEESVHKCGRCGQFCQCCHRVHSKFCSSPVTPLLTSPASLEEKVESLTTTLAQYQQKNQILEHKISALEQKNQVLEHKTSALEQKNQVLEHKTSALEQKDQILEQKNQILEQKNDVLTREVQSQKDKVSLVCQDLAMLQSQDHTKGMKDGDCSQGMMNDNYTKVLRQLQDLQTSTRNLETSTRNLETSSKAHGAALTEFKTHLAKSRTQVAFHVILHTNVKVRSQRVLILKNEVVNLGQCYNTNTGFFTAPVAGVYLFMATAASAEENKVVKLDLVHEGTVIAYTGTEQESSSCHASVRVAQGDRVWLGTVKPAEEGDYMWFVADWATTFTGVLVHPDY